MDDVPDARALSREDIAALLAAADSPPGPAVELREATPVERGFCTVYELELVDPGDADGSHTYYLKSSPDGDDWSIPHEARIQAVLDAHTDVPVPDVRWVVDEHDSLPTPSFLMAALPGEELQYEAVAEFEDDVLRRLARETGEHLGDLHGVRAPEDFGHVRHDGPELVGERPAGDQSTLTVGSSRETWPAYFEARMEYELDRLADSRFAELTDELRPWFEAGVDVLRAREGSFEPVLGRNDHGLHNLLVDPETGELTAMLDWGYTLAVPAAFDVEYAVYLYSGAFLAGLPDVADRRDLVREAMEAGYRTTAPDRVERITPPEPYYEALAMTRIMNDFHHLDLPDGTESAVMDRIRSDALALLD